MMKLLKKKHKVEDARFPLVAYQNPPRTNRVMETNTVIDTA